jgi:hypothetical protein
LPPSPVTTTNLSLRACWAALAAIAVATGCATGGGAPSSSPAVRAAPAVGNGRICFYRTTFHALSVQPDITIDGKAVGRAIPNAYFCVEREPGTFEIATVAEPDRKFAQVLAAGETRYVRLDFTVTWFLIAHINPVPVANDVGATEIEGLHEMR